MDGMGKKRRPRRVFTSEFKAQIVTVRKPPGGRRADPTRRPCFSATEGMDFNVSHRAHRHNFTK
jgi:hypothetical protein